VFCSRVRAAAKHSVLTLSSLQKEKQVFKSGFVRCLAQYKIKTASDGETQSFSRTMLESQQKGKFWVRTKFAFLHTKSTKINKIFNGHERKIYFISE
jgi:hypothetical protein